MGHYAKMNLTDKATYEQAFRCVDFADTMVRERERRDEEDKQ